MNFRSLVISLLCAFALALSGSSGTAGAAEMQYLRIATLAPRDSDLSKGFMKLDQNIRKVTNGGWGVRLYPSGVAGDEVDVLRKMKIGQMDASIITAIGLSQIVREATLLSTPGVIKGYKGWDAVRASLVPELEASFEKSGYKILGWGETGQLRMFAKQPLLKPTSVKTMRPWVWPASYAMKELWAALGATGVPLGVPEVYGALQTGMIDVVLSTCVALVSLQWQSNLKYMTKDTNGVLISAMLISSSRWKEMPADVQKIILDEITRNQAADTEDIRKADERSYHALLKRGYTANEWTGDAQKEVDTMIATVQKRLVGRMYTAEQLERVKTMANGQ